MRLLTEITIISFLEESARSPTSDDDLPDFLLPDDSNKSRKLPYFRTGAAPKIIKASLKDYHGLEGVCNILLLSLVFCFGQNAFASFRLV